MYEKYRNMQMFFVLHNEKINSLKNDVYLQQSTYHV